MDEVVQNSINVHIVLILTFGFVLASVLGYFSQRAKVSPILGYLLAGYIIGPYSPGFVADIKITEQLAEIGIILMMFGVGLHLKLQELLDVKFIAIPGAIIQSIFTTLVTGFLVVQHTSWSVEAGIVIGLSIAVASTVVMIRVLTENNQITTPQGHIALGWLIVEDILTVLLLLLLPALALSIHGNQIDIENVLIEIGVAMLKCAALIILTITIGFRLVSFIFGKVVRTRSQELFTLTVLGLTFGIAMGSTFLFGTSIALGAFIAGIVIGQTDVRHQASANALPIKDAFSVIFFLTVGMLFNPIAIFEHLHLFLGLMFIILVFKPVVAFVIIMLLKRPVKTGVVVGLALAQIGEFSFILVEEAARLKIIPDEGFDLIVACALLSIALNPLLFKCCNTISSLLQLDKSTVPVSDYPKIEKKVPRAIIVGFGPIGQDSAKMLQQLGLSTVLIDTNVDTIAKQRLFFREAVFGDATSIHILQAAHIDTAKILIITIPDITATVSIIEAVREVNPKIPIVARTIYTKDRSKLTDLNVIAICDEEEARHAFVRTLLRQRA